MFEISFTEILVIATVALVVIGPERLPKVARTLGHLFGRAQRYVNDVKSDIQREMELEELKKWKTSVEGAGRSIENTVRTELNKFEQATEEDIKSFGTPAPATREETATASQYDTLPPDSSDAHGKSLTSSRSEQNVEREQK